MKSGLATDFDEKHLGFAEKYLQKFVIVLLTDEINAENLSNDGKNNDKFQIFVGLQKIAQNIYPIQNMKSCLDILRKNSNQNVFLIIDIGDSMSEEDNVKLCSFINVEYIYHFGSANPWKKTRGEVSSDLAQLSQNKSYLHIFPQNVINTHIKNLDAETQRFIMRQLLIEILQHRSHTTETMKAFLAFCRHTYCNDNVRLRQIEEYEDQFIPKSSIWWYTKNTFAFRILNKTLRENDLSSMFKIRYYICDIYAQLKELYISQLATILQSKITLYRGKMISHSEFEHLSRSIKRFTATNSFVSTTTDEQVARSFISEGNSLSRDQVPVLFCMKLNLNTNKSKPVAFIREYSQNPDEEEVLLSIGMVFFIDSIKVIGENLWQIDLFRGSDEEQFETDLYMHVSTQIGQIDQSLSVISFLETINDGQYVAEYKSISISHMMQIPLRTSSSDQLTPWNDRRYDICVRPMYMCSAIRYQASYANPSTGSIPTRSNRTYRIVFIVLVILIIIAILLSIILPLTLRK